MQNNIDKDQLPDEEPVFITFHDEEGNDIVLEFLDLIEHGDATYAVMLPADESDEAGDVLIFKVESTENEDEDAYYTLDDEDLEIEIFEIFKERFKDEFNFVD